MVERFLGDKIALHVGDCREVLATLAENSLDACVTDPPYHLTSIVQRFGKPAGNSTKGYGSGFDMTASGTGGAMARLSRGFMGKVWDGGDISFDSETWAAVYRVLKPGAHLIAMGGTRTYHRLACAIEDASFEIRDTCAYIFGSGFPKSHSVGKKLDESASRCSCDSVCNMREDAASASISDQKNTSDILQLLMPKQDVCGTTAAIRAQRLGEEATREGIDGATQSGVEGWTDLPQEAWQLCERPLCEVSTGFDFDGESGRLCDGASLSDGADNRAAIATDGVRASSRPSTVEQYSEQSGTVAMQSEPQERGAWPRCGNCGKPIIPDGLGTALKPAMELLCLARKPLSEGTVAANVLRWGTGAINVDACRVPSGQDHADKCASVVGLASARTINTYSVGDGKPREDSYSSLGRWPANVVHDGSDEVVAAFPETGLSAGGGMKDLQNGKLFGGSTNPNITDHCGFGDSGSAARFFYTSKADADDRLGSKHPTVKPLDLMQWLVRLVTPRGGVVLDPFSGTGTTGEAAWREGMDALLVEAEPEYQADIRRRMALALAGPDERQRESIKARNLPRDDGPLFGGLDQLAPLEEPAAEYNSDDDFARSYDECPREIRERKAIGGPGWIPREREEDELGPLFAWKAQEAAE